MPLSPCPPRSSLPLELAERDSVYMSTCQRNPFWGVEHVHKTLPRRVALSTTADFPAVDEVSWTVDRGNTRQNHEVGFVDRVSTKDLGTADSCFAHRSRLELSSGGEWGSVYRFRQMSSVGRFCCVR